MAEPRPASRQLAPVSLTLWGCGIIIVWWAIVLGALAALGAAGRWAVQMLLGA